MTNAREPKPLPKQTGMDGPTALLAIVVFIVVLAAIAWVMGAGKPRPAGAQATAGGAGRSSVTYTGSGTMKTEPRPMAGDYSVAWTVAVTDPSCYFGLILRSPDTVADPYEQLANVAPENPPDRASGTTNVYGLKAASFYIDASSTCGDWSLTLKPR